MHVGLVANPTARSGHAARRVDSAVEALERAGATVQLVVAEHAAAASAELETLVRCGDLDRVLVLGGDGMVHLAVQVLAGGSVPLGILPHGSGNDVAAALAIPNDIDQAVAVALGPTQSLDLLDVGGTWAASIATFGFAGDVNARANAMAFPRGGSRYSLATVAALPGLRSRTVHMRIDDEVLDIGATLVAIANTDRFGGGMRVCPGARPDDGVLDITIVAPVSRWRLLRFFWRAFSGTHTDLPDVSTHRGRRVELTCPGVQVWADGEAVGEPLGDAPLVIELVAGALQVAAPDG